MNGKIFSSFFSSIASYFAGIYIKNVDYIPTEKALSSPELQALHEATRDTITFYLQNTAFVVSIAMGLLTMYFLIKKNLKKNAQQTNGIIDKT